MQSLLRLTIRDAAPESYQKTRESLENFESSLIRIKQGEKRKRKRCHPNFSTKNPIHKLAMNNRRLLIAAVFHFVHPVEKDI